MFDQKEAKVLYFAIFAAICVLPKTDARLIEKRYADGGPNTFDMEIFRATNEENDNAFMISPISLRIALGMMHEGARKETALEIRRALRLPDDPKLLREETKEWVKMLKTDETTNTTLTVANRIFPHRSYKINEHFRRTLQEIYGADVQPINRDEPQKAAGEINKWVEENTNGMIKKLMGTFDIAPDFQLAAVNTVYFKGTWKYQFRKNETKFDCFYNNGKNCVQREMMKTWINHLPYAYIKDLDAEVVDLPYDDKKHSMLIVLPKKRNGMHELVQNMKSYSIDKIGSSLKERHVTAKIPKFTASYRSEPKNLLISLGISRMFNPLKSELSGMLEGMGIYVSKVIHSTKIKVNEEGSEAAAATAMVTGSISSFPNKITWINFTADHPFLYFLKESSTNSILFAGKYTGA